MTEQKYNAQESLERIFRALSGNSPASDIPGHLTGNVYSWDTILSRLAELLAGSLPGETFSIPSAGLPVASTTQAGIVELATSQEAASGTSTTLAVTPAGVGSALQAAVGGFVEFGGIYSNVTGTATITLSTAWAKITGSFQGSMPQSTNVTSDLANDQIVLNHSGIVFCGFQTAFSGSANSTVELAIYVDGVRQPQVKTRRKLGATGDVGSCSAIGIINVTGTPVNLDLRAKADTGTPSFSMQAGQVWLYSVPGH